LNYLLKHPGAWPCVSFFDTLGNAWEFCGRQYEPYVQLGEAEIRVSVPDMETLAQRGACFNDDHHNLRSSFRGETPADDAHMPTGFASPEGALDSRWRRCSWVIVLNG
jgi:formylglycine-generating enzyme required for sulfatase activity